MNKLFKALLALMLSMAGAAQAATMTFDPNPKNAALNEYFTLDVKAWNFPITDGGGANISFNAGIVNVLAVHIDTTRWNFGSTGTSQGTIDNAAGTVTGILMNAASNEPSGDFVAFTVDFKAVGLGSTSLILSDYALNPWASGGFEINPSYMTGVVNVSSVPLPAAVWMMLSGLGVLGGTSRHRRRAG